MPLLSIVLVIGVVLIGLFIYWLVFLTEGAYLGESVVVWLYDVYAGRYDKIKDWDAYEEDVYLAQPFAQEVGIERNPPLILDVAAGTGRLTRAIRKAKLLQNGRWVLLDASVRMLRIAREHLGEEDRLHYVVHSARRLPFPDEMFDVVTCMEALEFMPQPHRVMEELVRVLRPGGLLVTTNRVGTIAKMMPGRTWAASDVFRMQKELGQNHIRIRPFLVDYEWVSSTKRGRYQAPGKADDLGYTAILETLPKLD